MTLYDGNFDVEAVDGDSHLGGEDFDSRLVNHFVQELQKEHNKDLRSNERAMQHLRKECEEVKKTLSSAFESSTYLEFPDYTLDTSISRSQFDKMCADLFQKTTDPVERAIENAGLTKSDINDVILVSGLTRMAKIDDLLTNFFGKKPLNNVHPDEAGKWNIP